MHFTVTLDVISTKIHVHVLSIHQNHPSEVCQVILSFCSALYETKNEARDIISFVSQCVIEGAKQHLHFC